MIIGITGKKFHGKSEIADYIIHGKYPFKKWSFASKVKEVAKLIYNLYDDQLYGDKKDVLDNRYNLTPRFIMQRIGTEVARSIHRQTWVISLERDILNSNPNVHSVIDDCRFLNESDWIRSKQGVIIKVIRPSTMPLDEHQSETEIEHIHSEYIIYNNKDIPHLHKEVNFVLGKLTECLERRCNHNEHSIIR